MGVLQGPHTRAPSDRGNGFECVQIKHGAGLRSNSAPRCSRVLLLVIACFSFFSIYIGPDDYDDYD